MNSDPLFISNPALAVALTAVLNNAQPADKISGMKLGVGLAI